MNENLFPFCDKKNCKKRALHLVVEGNITHAHRCVKHAEQLAKKLNASVANAPNWFWLQCPLCKHRTVVKGDEIIDCDACHRLFDIYTMAKAKFNPLRRLRWDEYMRYLAETDAARLEEIAKWTRNNYSNKS